MRIVIATDGLSVRGGVHSYLDAVLPELAALEHEVHVVAPEFGRPGAIRDAGGATHTSHDTVPRPVAGVLSFLDYSALEARAAHPRVPLVAVSHGPWYPQDVPSALAQPCALVALSGPSEQRLKQSRAAHGGVQVHRLTQPAEVMVPRAHNLPAQEPRHAVFVAHRMTSRRDHLMRACRERGIEPVFLGGHDRDEEILATIASADFVGGVGRVIIEAMALGRPALVMDEIADGRWVTPETYVQLEQSGFYLTPKDSDVRVDIGEMLDGYCADYGRIGREFALKNHPPALHAATLVRLIRDGHGPRQKVERQMLEDEAERRRTEHAAYFAEREAFWCDASAMRARHEAGARVDELAAEVSALHSELTALTASTSWRITAPLRKLSAAARRRRAPR
jgi:hypothetical protein